MSSEMAILKAHTRHYAVYILYPNSTSIANRTGSADGLLVFLTTIVEPRAS